MSPIRKALIAWLQQGQKCLDCGDLSGAEQALRSAIHSDGSYVPALYNLGNILLARGDAEAAALYYERALRLQPTLVPAWQNLGSSHLRLGHFQAAEAAFMRVLALEPDSAQACYNLGVVRNAAGDLLEARTRFRQALALDPGFADAAINLAGLSLEVGENAEALSLSLRAVVLAPASPAAHNALGSAWERTGNAEAALVSYRRAVQLDPDSPDLRFNLATLLLLLERWDEGWSGYEARLKTVFCPFRAPVAPPWDGRSLAGERLLVLAEQGLGDTIQFCRYLPLIPGEAEVVFLVQPGLGGLLESVPGAAQVLEWDLRSPLPENLGCDFQIHLISLPGILGTRSETIPAAVPYLHPDPARLRRITERLGPRDALRIGLVTSGNPNHPRNRFRNCPFECLLPLLELPGVRFYNLQQGLEADCITADGRVGDLAPYCREPEDLAAALRALDLLVTTDTMPAHLAGALGAQVWTLLDAAPDWRWMRHREDSPWYPTMRIFRQPSPGAWGEVVNALRCAIENLLLRQ